MTATGHIYTTKHRDVDYYYLPSKEKWTLNMKEVSLGDIYFSNVLVKASLGIKSEEPPKLEDYPDLDGPITTREISISLQ